MDELDQTTDVLDRGRGQDAMAKIEDVPGPVAGILNHPPRPLFQLQFRGWDVRYHVAPMPDGSRFVMNVPVANSSPPPLSFVLNWLGQ